MSDPAPLLSVFTIAHETADDCVDAITSLGGLTNVDRVQLVLVSPDRELADPSILDPFHSVKWVDMTPRNCGESMAAGVRAGDAPYVVYAEEHATFDPDWAQRLVDAHESGYDVVGFVMSNSNPETLVSWAHYYLQFGDIAPPVDPGPRGFLAGHHVSYSKALLMQLGDGLQPAMEDEAALFLMLRHHGVPLYLAADAVSTHLQVSKLRALMSLDYFGARSFAHTRVGLENWPIWKRAVYVLGSPLIPFVRIARTMKHIRRTKRMNLFPGLLWPMGLTVLAGTVGEVLGYLFGPGQSAELKTAAELSRADFLSFRDPYKKTDTA